MTDSRLAVLVLAAGKGTRMRSGLAKVLHNVANRPLVAHVLAAAAPLGAMRTVVVLAPGMEDVARAVAPAETAIQREQRGTAHAVLAAKKTLDGFSGDVLVLNGDGPLVTTATLEALLAERRRGKAAVTVLGMRPADPAPYGRLVTAADGTLAAIVEAADASAKERAIGLCNSGLWALDGKELWGLLDGIGANNAKGEHYLTDIVAAARKKGLACRAIEGPADELLGVNSRADLAAAEALMQRRLRARAMEDGVTLVAPETVFLSADTKIGRDTVVGPFVVFGPGVTVGEGVQIPAFCHMVEATIGDRASIGPFARLRPGAELGRGGPSRQFRRGQECAPRPRRQGQSPGLYRRRRRRRGQQYRRRRHHLQLRRHRQVPHRDRQVRVRRHQRLAGGAGRDRRRRLHRRRQRHHRRRAGRRHGDRARPAGDEARPRQGMAREPSQVQGPRQELRCAASSASSVGRMWRRSSSTGCAASNIAAMIRPGSRRWSTDGSSAAAPRASSSISKRASCASR